MLIKAEERKGENMKLEDVLVITSEATIVNVVDYESNKVISRYDGRDSIDKELNSRQVVRQYVRSDELYIVVLECNNCIRL